MNLNTKILIFLLLVTFITITILFIYSSVNNTEYKGFFKDTEEDEY